MRTILHTQRTASLPRNKAYLEGYGDLGKWKLPYIVEDLGFRVLRFLSKYVSNRDN